MDVCTWTEITQLREWLDERGGDQTEQERRLLRVLAIGSEFGEAARAVHGVLGANPEQGCSHSWSDVRTRLCAVIVTAMVALDTVSGDAAHVLDVHLGSLVDRTPQS
ncbi:MazG-like family protein [Streptomyces sp. NPDC047097]|uniref:MazG-like family protein n=1 Tax=Streptomyces sp. NPDC047097 TaxID=3155260 RepID=UPI0033C1B7FB